MNSPEPELDNKTIKEYVTKINDVLEGLTNTQAIAILSTEFSLRVVKTKYEDRTSTVAALCLVMISMGDVDKNKVVDTLLTYLNKEDMKRVYQ